jgi:hypothetical protein
VSKILIFDPQGSPLAEITADTTRSWVLNEMGRCDFVLSTSDPNCKPDILRFGNWVYIKHIPTVDVLGVTRGTLPDWVGIILPPRFRKLGSIGVTAFSAEQYLFYRPMPFVNAKGTIGTVFKEILSYAATYGGIVVQPGEVYSTSTEVLRPLRLSAFEEIKQLVKIYKTDFEIVPSISNTGALSLTANLYQERGAQTQYLLTDGAEGNIELQDPTIQEQGELVNYVIGYNMAQTPSTRIRWEEHSDVSMSEYGTLARNIVINAMTATDVKSGVISYLNRSKKSYMSSAFSALDKDKVFDWMEVGNIFPIQFFAGGFYSGETMVQGTARLISPEYNDITNRIKLSVDITEAS